MPSGNTILWQPEFTASTTITVRTSSDYHCELVLAASPGTITLRDPACLRTTTICAFQLTTRLAFALVGLICLLPSAGQTATCSYTLAIPTDWSMVANQCDHPSGNTLNNIFPNVPNGSKIAKWNNQTQAWEPLSFFLGGNGSQNYTLNPGEGAFFWNPGPPFNVTIPFRIKKLGIDKFRFRGDFDCAWPPNFEC